MMDNFLSVVTYMFLFIFQLEVNPNLVVAELSFENNVVQCDLTYTGYYARIHNCERKSLL